MKIILSPSKTRTSNEICNKLNETMPRFENAANKLASILHKLSKDDLSKIMKIKNGLLDKTYDEYTIFKKALTFPAIYSYTGTVYKELDINNYSTDELTYMNDSVRIMSALYGILKPSDLIKHYRLDMTMKIMDESLYKYWHHIFSQLSILDYDTDKNSPQLIINLSSSEFSKMLTVDYVNIEFKEFKNGIYKVVGTYSKKARGVMANYMIKNKVTTISEILLFTEEGYLYNEVESTKNNIVFTR